MHRPLVVVALLLAATIFYAQAHLRTLHPLIDSGRDLYLAAEIRDHGAKLYRDSTYNYLPLAPYLLAAVTSIIGDSLASYTILGIVTALLAAAALFATGWRIGNLWIGGAAALLFIALSFTNASARGCNFIFPYSHAATIGMTFLLLQQAALAAFLFGSGRRIWFWLAFAAAMVAGWCKLEFAVPAVAAFALAVLVEGRCPQRPAPAHGAPANGAAEGRAPPLRDMGIAAAVAIASVFAVNAYFAGSDWLWLLDSPVLRHFYRQVAGTDALGKNLVQAIVGAALIAAACALLRATGPLRYAAILLLPFLTTDRFFRAWSILMPILAIVALRRREREDRILLFLLFFAFAGAARIYFNLAPIWFGFVFLIPLFVLVPYVLVRYLPHLGVYGGRAARLWLIVFVVIAARGYLFQRTIYSAKVHRVDTPKGSYYDDSEARARGVAGLLDHLQRRRPETLVVLPEGVAINYFTGIRDPLRYHTFSAAELMVVEDDVVRDFARHRPEAVAINNQFVEEFGVGPLGEGYGRNLIAFLRMNYEVEQRWPSETFSMTLLRPRNTSPWAAR